ncbi:hypothetical protein ACQJBY_046373 [Aegilops geniculata]
MAYRLYPTRATSNRARRTRLPRRLAISTRTRRPETPLATYLLHCYPSIIFQLLSSPTRPRRHRRHAQSGGFVVSAGEIRMSDPKYAYPYPAQGYYQGGPYQGQGGPYQGPPVMAPPQYAAPPPRAQPSFLEGCLAALCCCCLIDECCCDPSIIFVG